MDAWEDQRSREATESARKRADELGIDIAVVGGTGSNGRVTRDDVDAHAEKLLRDPASAGSPESEMPPALAKGGEVSELPQTPAEPGEHIVPPEQVPAEASPEVEVGISDGCVRFHCSTNPNFNLQSHKLGGAIHFTDGYYETGDPAEIAALRACQSVEEVSDCTCGPGDACGECPE